MVTVSIQGMAHAVPSPLHCAWKIICELWVGVMGPMEMLRCACETIELLERARELSSPLLLSDVGCGASLARAAAECAAINVRVNTRSLPGDPESMVLEEEVGRLAAEYLPRAEAVSASVTRWLLRL